MRVDQTWNVGEKVYRTRLCRDDKCRWRVTTIETYAEDQVVPNHVRLSTRKKK